MSRHFPLFFTAILVSAPGFAQLPDSPQSAASIDEGMRACRGIADDLQRVRCYDALAGRYLAGRDSGDLLLIDRRQTQQVRRNLFGFPVPDLGLLGGRKDEEETNEIEGQVTTARHIGDGRYRLRLADNAVWLTTERSRAGAEPRAGSKVRIRKGALGGYFMTIDGNRAVRATRSE